MKPDYPALESSLKNLGVEFEEAVTVQTSTQFQQLPVKETTDRIEHAFAMLHSRTMSLAADLMTWYGNLGECLDALNRLENRLNEQDESDDQRRELVRLERVGIKQLRGCMPIKLPSN